MFMQIEMSSESGSTLSFSLERSLRDGSFSRASVATLSTSSGGIDVNRALCAQKQL